MQFTVTPFRTSVTSASFALTVILPVVVPLRTYTPPASIVTPSSVSVTVFAPVRSGAETVFSITDCISDSVIYSVDNVLSVTFSFLVSVLPQPANNSAADRQTPRIAARCFFMFFIRMTSFVYTIRRKVKGNLKKNL